MKKLIIKVIGVLVLICFLIYLFYSPRLKFDVLENPNKNTTKTTQTTQTQDFDKSKNTAENPMPKDGVGTWVGQSLSKLTKKYGQADRVYPYKDNYKNYVFKEKEAYYLVTTKDGIIKSVYATGKKANVEPLHITNNAAHVFEKFSVNPEPTITSNGKKYELELSDTDMKTQSLVKFKNMYAQIYIDQQSNHIVAVRFLDSDALAEFKPYQMVTSKEEKEVKSKHGNAPYAQSSNQLMTLYEITNEMRKLKNTQPLKINNKLAHIASFNLYEATGQDDSAEFTEDALRDQLNAQEVPFTYSSQNVGYDFNDVPTLIHSWLNSDTHRSRMLNAKYNEMGGEVMEGYYTLIFVGEKKKGDDQE
ncbi:CAP domain-containing protein [Staphylococcus gallinarum]|uniref:Allergen V5/Tpx-1 like protein n=3 Tax=Staphylococcus TaxID=1279 RepID=A0A0D0SIG1_STAGA|nr:CAP domain-containing protein [Staphylococcus gallinarum]KIR12170.1 SCP-like extracellular protein [Staphylococcus gallinarum]MCD8900575.1 SCP-like extracellular protein [Staphylococcus gallinarum]MCD8901827.1 SCP-like extracellular protein [Staphylococcus gallinarum]MCD8910101.1 SCP-like extracellular protein [Staphylococcus gallinarum]MCD8920622.1 SCP-like extracellular protein [Staphylococcus gallinarum]